MPAIPVPILFIHYGDQWIRGSEQLLLDLLTHLDLDRFRPIVWCNGTKLADAARSAGFTTYQTDFKYYFVEGSPSFRVKQYWSLVRQGISLVREYDIRILHANSAAPSQWLVPVSRITRRPLLVHLHIDYLRRSRFVFLLHQATLVIGVCGHAIKELVKDGMSDAEVIYNGIDFDRLRSFSEINIRGRLGIGDESVIISAIGSLVKRKGQDVLIKSLKFLKSRSDVRLLVAGDGPERSNFERLTTELDLQNKILFLGYCDRDEISAVYRATDIVALASRAEALSLVIAEAGFFSLPVVASAVGGTPDLVKHEETGLLVPPDQPEAFAAALSRLIDDSAYRVRLGKAAKDRVEKLFSVDHLVANFQTTYERLLQIPRSRLGWIGAGLRIKPYVRLLQPAFHTMRSPPPDRLADP